jgi:dihydroorotate dehydrogenase (NAD+) catalytic subunit
MGEILNAMFPGMNYPEPKLTDLEPMKQSVRAIKARVKIPVIVKLSGTFMHIVGDWARGVKEAGADGIASSDALGTGPAIMPIALRMVLDIAQTIDLPIVGVGGVGSASDVVEYLMAGATLVGVCTAGHLNGPARYTKIIADLGKLLTKLGVKDLSEVRGLTLKRIRERAAQGKAAVTKPVPAVVERKLCNGCTLCERVCVYGAAVMNGRTREARKAVIDPATCVGCGLCVSVCPTEAIRQVYY